MVYFTLDESVPGVRVGREHPSLAEEYGSDTSNCTSKECPRGRSGTYRTWLFCVPFTVKRTFGTRTPKDGYRGEVEGRECRGVSETWDKCLSVTTVTFPNDRRPQF